MDENKPAPVISLRRKKLYPKGKNCFALTMEQADAKAIECYASIKGCETCHKHGKVILQDDPEKKIHFCPDCNGYGYAVVMLRESQVKAVDDTQFDGPCPNDPPTDQGPRPA